MTYFLTSSPSVSMDGAINPANGFLSQLQQVVPQNSRVVFVSANPSVPAFGDHCTVSMARAFEDVGFTFEAFDCLDRRNSHDAARLIGKSDWVILGGGHVPTQNEFLHEIALDRLLHNYDGVVMGISAGSMNMARTVYAQPEEQGEAIDPSYERFRRGLGITEVQVLPHYYMCKEQMVDGLRIYDEVAMPDSAGNRFYAFPDGTYLVGRNGKETIYGEFFVVENGVMRKVLDNGQSIELPFI